MEEVKKNIIFVDMDGVITNWYDAAMEVMKLDKNDPEIQNAISVDHAGMDKLVGKDTVVTSINEAGRDFWVNLEKLPWADELMNLLIAKGEDHNAEVAFLSKPGRWVEAYSGKYIWVQKYYPDIPLILCRHKGMVASPTAALIDDDPIQLDYFYNRGGWTHQWPNQFSLVRKGSAYWHTELDMLSSYLEVAFDPTNLH